MRRKTYYPQLPRRGQNANDCSHNHRVFGYSVKDAIKKLKGIRQVRGSPGAAHDPAWVPFVHSWIFQITAAAMVWVYLGRQCRALHQRNHQSWDDLLSRLIPDWRSLCETSLAGSADAQLPPGRPAEIWALCRNAQALQAIADHALRNFALSDRSLAQQLHRDATVLRLRALAALARHAMGRPAKAHT
jgi:hypothetical protein